MNRPGKILLIAGLCAVLLALGSWLRGEFRIDSCLDRGGRWDGVRKVCIGAAD